MHPTEQIGRQKKKKDNNDQKRSLLIRQESLVHYCQFLRLPYQ